MPRAYCCNTGRHGPALRAATLPGCRDLHLRQTSSKKTPSHLLVEEENLSFISKLWFHYDQWHHLENYTSKMKTINHGSEFSKYRWKTDRIQHGPWTNDSIHEHLHSPRTYLKHQLLREHWQRHHLLLVILRIQDMCHKENQLLVKKCKQRGLLGRNWG